ncbi:MAG: hypothetical protein WA354_09790 [Terracidiphilus sp.]
MNKLLKSYFYWTFPRGHVHYDVLVTLILLFIFVTPHLWDFGDKPSRVPGPQHPIQVVSDGSRGIIVTVNADDLFVPTTETDSQVRKQLRKAIEPVTGDAVSVTRWETALDAQGNRVWKIWARR